MPAYMRTLKVAGAKVVITSSSPDSSAPSSASAVLVPDEPIVASAGTPAGATHELATSLRLLADALDERVAQGI